MADAAVISWAKEQLKAGFTAAELRQLMLDTGYSAKEADEAIAEAQRPPHQAFAPKPQPTPAKPEPAKPTPAERLAIKDSEPAGAVHYEVDFSERASRLELFIRFFYLIPVGIVLSVLTFLVSIVLPLEWLHTLLLGRRNKALNDVVYKYSQYFARANSYALLLTDERPPIIRGVGKLVVVAVVLYAVLIGAMLAAVWYVVLPMLGSVQLPALPSLQ